MGGMGGRKGRGGLRRRRRCGRGVGGSKLVALVGPGALVPFGSRARRCMALGSLIRGLCLDRPPGKSGFSSCLRSNRAEICPISISHS